ncbi:MAG: cupin domain-containing protein [Deltaproteobacteria bacterium]|nr:cupin domain-containing protein [Deltaproteobacteria bacterium]
MTITARNIFTRASAPAGLEECLILFESAKVRVERIVSNTHSSPAGFWYDQPEDEWVMVLRGQATLQFPGGQSMAMRAGDHVTIASHVRHRVSETDAETIWLAVHVKPQP